DVADFASEYARGSEDLVQQLEKVTQRLGASDNGARLTLARRQEELLRTLERKKDRPGELVTALAASRDAEGRYLGATQQEASLSITSAPDVAAVARNIGANVDTLLAGRDRTGALGPRAVEIIAALVKGVDSHEFHAHLDGVVRAFEKAAQDWINDLVRVEPPKPDPQPTSPDPSGFRTEGEESTTAVHPADSGHSSGQPTGRASTVAVEGTGTRRHFTARRSAVQAALSTALDELSAANSPLGTFRVEITFVESDERPHARSAPRPPPTSPPWSRACTGTSSSPAACS